MYVNNPVHITKMATVSLYGKNPSEIFPKPVDQFHENMTCSMIYYNVYINYDPVLTLTYFLQGQCRSPMNIIVKQVTWYILDLRGASA